MGQMGRKRNREVVRETQKQMESEGTNESKKKTSEEQTQIRRETKKKRK